MTPFPPRQVWRAPGQLTPTFRTARIAVHSASTLALFLIETWQKSSERSGE